MYMTNILTDNPQLSLPLRLGHGVASVSNHLPPSQTVVPPDVSDGTMLGTRGEWSKGNHWPCQSASEFGNAIPGQISQVSGKISMYSVTVNRWFQTSHAVNNVSTGTYSRHRHKHVNTDFTLAIISCISFSLWRAISSGFPLRRPMHCPLWLCGHIRSVFKINPFFCTISNDATVVIIPTVQHHSQNGAACHHEDPMSVHVGSMAHKGSPPIIPLTL